MRTTFRTTRRTRRLHILAPFALLASLAGCLGGPAEPAPVVADTPCGELAAHILELELAGAAEALPPGDFAQIRDNALAMGQSAFAARCEDELTEQQLECQLAATSTAAVAACLDNPRPENNR